jgi:hypothetical protein
LAKESGNGWSAWENFVLKKLEEQKKWLVSLSEKQENMRVEMASLKEKAGVWGLLGACIPVAILLAINLLSRR